MAATRITARRLAAETGAVALGQYQSLACVLILAHPAASMPGVPHQPVIAVSYQAVLGTVRRFSGGGTEPVISQT
jgi:hypothetical protein